MNTTEQRAPELHWPAGYPRTPAEERESYPGDISLTRKEAFESIVDELERWGATDVRISTASTHYKDRPNIPHQHDKPAGVGVAVRFRREDRPATEGYAIACDRWETQLENARGPVCTRGGNASPSGMASRLQTRSSRPPGCRRR